MKKIISVAILFIFITLSSGCEVQKKAYFVSENESPEIIKENIDYYLAFGNNNRYRLCENADEQIGKCILGNYRIVSGKLDGDVTIEWSPERSYDDGEWLGIFDVITTQLELKRNDKYENNIISEDLKNKKNYMITIEEEVESVFAVKLCG